MEKYILALDEGTTSSRAILFDKSAHTVSMAQHEFPQIYPQPGYVEHDPMCIFTSQMASLSECLEKGGVRPDELAAIGITNQRETTVVWNRHTGKPVYNAIVWQCRRTTDICEELIRNGCSDMIEKKTGLRPDAYFSGTKVKWILDNVPGAREEAEAGNLLFGTVDTWLLWKLTDGAIHATDRTNASRTMLYNIEKDEWDEELLSLLQIPSSMLPKVQASGSLYGNANINGTNVPVCGIAGDQQAALFGQGCFTEGDVKNTYGTGCFMLNNTGKHRIYSKNGLISTAAATLSGEEPEYALEGSVFVAGAVVKWLRDELRLIQDARDTEYFAGKVSDNGGVYMVPAFVGIGAPYWDMRARGSLFGLTRGVNRNHIIRAAIESIAYQTEDILRAMEKDIAKPITSLKVDGGASANRLLMQFQSDISDICVTRPSSGEATALGAAFLAGLTCGFWKNREELTELINGGATYFTPSMDETSRQKLLTGWHKAVNACRAFE